MVLIRRKGFKQFLTLCLKYKYLYMIVIILQLCGTAASLLLAEFSRRLFDGGPNLSYKELYLLLCGIVVAVFAALLFSLLSRVSNQIVNTNVVFQMRQMVLNQLTNLSLGYHENQHSSKTNNLLFNELEVFKHFVVFDVLRLIALPFSFIAVGVYLLTVHPLLGIIAVCVGPLQLIGNLVVKEKFKDLIAMQQSHGGEVFFHMGETIAGIREIKMNQLERSVRSRFQQICERGVRLWVSIEKMEAYRELIRQFPEKIGYVAGLGVGAVLMVNGDVGPGALVAFITLLGKASEPFTDIASVISSLQRVSAGAENLLDLMELETENNDEGQKLSSQPPLIEFDRVSFAYKEGFPVLKNVSFTIPAGKSVALVGPSGGGKSTLVKLLYRFYTPQSGVIKVNGIPIQQYSTQSLRERLAAVTQDVYLFDGTVRENIAIGSAEADSLDINNAALYSQSMVFINELPERFETKVGERGIRLSQGQKQRIGIARAILRRASILILDEPTSALDVETESMFQADLTTWAGASTTIIIAHRLSTIRNVDYIVFLENGEIRETGTPQDLLETGGRFMDFWSKQEIREFVS